MLDLNCASDPCHRPVSGSDQGKNSAPTETMAWLPACVLLFAMELYKCLLYLNVFLSTLIQC